MDSAASGFETPEDPSGFLTSILAPEASREDGGALDLRAAMACRRWYTAAHLSPRRQDRERPPGVPRVVRVPVDEEDRQLSFDRP